MKYIKTILLTLIILVGLFFHSSSEVVRIDKKEYKAGVELNSQELSQCILENIDEEELTEENLSSITKLYCGNSEISDTSDLELLTNLEELDLSDNEIESIDLSNNTKLKKLDLSNNYINELKLPDTDTLELLNLNSNNLKEIDLSKLTNLKALAISSNPLEKGLDVTKNTNLMALYASSSWLSTIDLSKNTKLVYLNLFDNMFEEIDLSKNTDLELINLSENALSSIDFSHNTKLTDIYISSNYLEELSLSNQSNLKRLNATFNNLSEYDIPNKSNIDYLAIDYDWIDAFDFSEFTNLQRLLVTYNEVINVVGNSLNMSELYKKIPDGVSTDNFEAFSTMEDVCECAGLGEGSSWNASNFLREAALNNKVSWTPGTPASSTTSTGLNCMNAAIVDNTIDPYDIYNVQLYSPSVNIDGLELDDSVNVEFAAYFRLENVETGAKTDSDGNQVLTNVPNTGISIIGIIIGGVLVLLTGTYIILKETQTKKVRND